LDFTVRRKFRFWSEWRGRPRPSACWWPAAAGFGIAWVDGYEVEGPVQKRAFGRSRGLESLAS
jgi:hypothetical protein